MKHLHTDFDGQMDGFQVFGSFTTIPKELKILGYPPIDIISVRYWTIKSENSGTFILPAARAIYLFINNTNWEIGLIEDHKLKPITNDDFYNWLKDVIIAKYEEVS